MKLLNTIQTKEKLNNVWSVDEPGAGGAYHQYVITKCAEEGNNLPVRVLAEIQMQCGPRNEEGSKDGFIDGDLLEIVRDRLKAFQAGPFSSEYNEEALQHIEAALMALNKRVEDRIERNVLGRSEK